MGNVKISLEIFEEIEKALDLGYNRLYVNVDNLENGFGFLRVLAMDGLKDIVVYEGTFELDLCYHIVCLLEISKYNIKDFTVRWDDD